MGTSGAWYRIYNEIYIYIYIYICEYWLDLLSQLSIPQVTCSQTPCMILGRCLNLLALGRWMPRSRLPSSSHYAWGCISDHSALLPTLGVQSLKPVYQLKASFALRSPCGPSGIVGQIKIGHESLYSGCTRVLLRILIECPCPLIWCY